MPRSDQEKFHELTFYTLSHPDPSFIHQHVVDAWFAQKADDNSKLIGICFALIGLYLYLEKGFTGKQVQEAHVRMSGRKKFLKPIRLPAERGEITIDEVLAAKPGIERDLMIKEWCKTIWIAYRESHEEVITLSRELFEQYVQS